MCLKSGAPGSSFTPTITFGALIGGLFGEGWSYMAPAISKESYAVVGTEAIPDPDSQGPISSVVFVLN